MVISVRSQANKILVDRQVLPVDWLSSWDGKDVDNLVDKLQAAINNANVSERDLMSQKALPSSVFGSSQVA